MKPCFGGGFVPDACPQRVTRVSWSLVMAAAAVLWAVAGGCGDNAANPGAGDGGLAQEDLGPRFGFSDTGTAALDDSGTSAMNDVVEGADQSDGGVAGDASDVGVCGDETCDAWEADSCPQDCNADCGGTLCEGEELCHDGATCAVPTAGTTIIYATTDEYDGNLGGRLGADRICQGDLPAGLSCGPPMALLSVTAGDSVAALSRERLTAARHIYAFDRGTDGLTLLADGWSHALNAHSGSAPALHATLLEGTSESYGSWSGFWSGSQADGDRQPDGSCGAGCVIDYTCDGWTTNVPTGATDYYGTQGDAGSTKKWLHSSSNYVGCNNKMRLLCACRQK